jgi:hypothetical protein
MNEKLTLDLVSKYPKLFRDINAPVTNSLMAFGFECGDGWYDIIDVLCGLLTSDFQQAKARYESVKMYYETDGRYPWLGCKEITSEMVEELRLAMEDECQKVPVAVQVKEKFGGLRFYVHGATNEAHNYIDFAERMSYRTCETCGKPGKTIRNGWHYTACEEHTREEDKDAEDSD